jgi:fatty-acid peroxygenase
MEQAREEGTEGDESALRSGAPHHDDKRELLDTHTAAVEVLNIIRTTAAVAWFMTCAAHAMHRWLDRPERHRVGHANL